MNQLLKAELMYIQDYDEMLPRLRTRHNRPAKQARVNQPQTAKINAPQIGPFKPRPDHIGIAQAAIFKNRRTEITFAQIGLAKIKLL